MPTTVILSDIQRQGGLNGGWGVYDMGSFHRGGVHYGLGRESCPEGAVWSESAGKCVCRSGRVWAPDNSKCVSPQSYLITGGGTMQTGTGASFSQQKLSDNARRYIEQTGHSIRCKIDDRWSAGPQGGDPARVCSIDGGPYKYGAYAINANPRSVITSLKRSQAIRQLEAQGVDVNSIDGSAAVSNLTNALDTGFTAQFVANANAAPPSGGGGDASTPVWNQHVTVQDGVVQAPQPFRDASGDPYVPGGGGGMVDTGLPDGGGGYDFSTIDNTFGGDVAIGDSEFPVWLLVAAAAGAAYMFSKKR